MNPGTRLLIDALAALAGGPTFTFNLGSWFDGAEGRDEAR